MYPVVLIVDDFGICRETARSFLRYSMVEVLTARDGAEGFRIATERFPSLIYADMLMPHAGGVELAERLREEPWGDRCPVILMINPDDPSQLEEAERSRAGGFISKPLERREFLAKGRELFPRIDRREPRVPCETIVTYGGEGFVGEASSLDLSVGGMYLVTPDRLPVETSVTLTFTLPGDDLSTLVVDGRVAWANHAGTGRFVPHLPDGFGVEFRGMPETIRAHLQKFVRKTWQRVSAMQLDDHRR